MGGNAAAAANKELVAATHPKRYIWNSLPRRRPGSAAGPSKEPEFLSQRILIRPVTFGHRFADNGHLQGRFVVPDIEFTTAQQRYFHRAEIIRPDHIREYTNPVFP